MKTSTIIVCVTILAGAGLIAAAPSRTISRPVYAAASSTPGTSSRIDAIVQQAIKEEHFSGAVLVRQGSTVLLRKGYGMADAYHRIPNLPSTKFVLPGMTALFTTVALEQLAERGKLAHGSIQDVAGGDSARLEASIRLIQHASGESYSAYLQQHMFRPLGMTHTEVRQINGMTPIVYSTLDDLDHWSQAVLGCRLISPQTLFASVVAGHLLMVPAGSQQGATAGERISMINGTTIIVLSNQSKGVGYLLTAVQRVLPPSTSKGARI